MAIDRLSILTLKVSHERGNRRTDVSQEHIDTCNNKLSST